MCFVFVCLLKSKVKGTYICSSKEQCIAVNLIKFTAHVYRIIEYLPIRCLNYGDYLHVFISKSEDFMNENNIFGNDTVLLC